MTTAQLYRLSGLALVLGAISSAVSSIVSGVAFPDTSNPAAATNPVNVLLTLIGVAGTTLVLLGLPGMSGGGDLASGSVAARAPT